MKKLLEENNVESQLRIGKGRQPDAPGGRERKSTIADAIKYVQDIKEIFRDQPEIYHNFLAALNDFKSNIIDTAGVIVRLKELFKGHNNLIYGFNTFLPEGFEITLAELTEPLLKKPVEYEDALAFMLKLKKRCREEDQEQTYKCFHEILRMYHTGQMDICEVDVETSRVLEDHLDLLKEFSKFLPNSSSSAPALHTQRGSNSQHPELGEDKVMMKLQKDELNCAVDGRVDYFALVSSDGINALKSKYRKEFRFCEKVMEKLGPVDYQLFLKGLKGYSKERVTRRDLQCFVADLLGKDPDLMEGFTEFIERCGNIGVFLAGLMNGTESILNDEPLLQEVKANEKDKGPMREIDPPKAKSNKECSFKSIHELDLSNCKRCSSSYRLLPCDYPIRMSKRVLNDHWATMTSRSEDCSFNHVCRNHYEESLFKSEEDRYELDMFLESLNSTVKKVEDLLTSITGCVNEDDPIQLEEHFKPCNLRCIKRLYGDHGLEVIDTLRKHPALSLPTILFRLKQKQEMWAQHRVEYNKIWDEIYSKNQSKPFDHRGFYFKQQDSKNMSIKYLVAEIKEIKENKQKEDDTLLAVASLAPGNQRPLVPHFKFEYFDNDIHEDILTLIKFSCEEMCSTVEHQNKVIMLCTTFLEPMLRFTSHAQQRLAKDRPSTSSAQPKTQNCGGVADKPLEQLPSSSALPHNISESHRESECLLSSAKPLTTYVSSSSGHADKNDSLVFYGNNTFYAVFRLYRMLYERLVTAKTNSTCPTSKCSNPKDECHVDPYARFKKALYHLLAGSTDNTKFDDDCHSIIGNQSYVLFTLDKLIYKLLKQLEVAATGEIAIKLVELYEYERSRENFIDSVYHENARGLLLEDNIYRFEFSSSPNLMSIQLMENANEKPEMVAVCIEPYFGPYVFNDFVSLNFNRKECEGIVLHRNKSNYAGLDDYAASTKAMEGVRVSNGLECKLHCSSSKIFYVPQTEDVFFRAKKARKNSSADFSRKLNQARVRRFYRRFNPMQI